VIHALEALKLGSATHRMEREIAIGYFANNADRMHDDRYNAEGLFVGSGVVEAGCRTVIGRR
jgi:hypothetical protein